MKVTRNMPEQLIIGDVPWLIGAFLILFIMIFVGVGVSLLISGELWGLVFAGFGGGIGLLFFAIFVRRTQIIFDRSRNRLTIRVRSVFGYTESHRVLSDVQEAILEDSTDSDGDTTYRPTLVMRGGHPKHLPLVSVYTNARGPGRAVEAINAWLDAGKLDSDAQAP